MSNLAGEVVLASERRGAERQEANDTASTFMQGSPDAISCVVCDVSDTGTRIRLKSTAKLPSRFKLCILDKHLLADCELVWRKKNEVGLKFRSVAYID